MSNIKDFASSLKREISKKEAKEREEQKRHDEWGHKMESVENRQSRLLEKVNKAMLEAVQRNKDFAVYLLKLADIKLPPYESEIVRGSIVLFEAVCGTHQKAVYGSCGEAHSLRGEESYIDHYKTVKSIYRVLLFLETLGGYDRRAKKLELAIEITGNWDEGSRSFYLFPHPLEEYVVPKKVSNKILSILNRLCDSESVLKFFEENHDRLILKHGIATSSLQ